MKRFGFLLTLSIFVSTNVMAQNVFRKGRTYIVTLGNFSDNQTSLSVKLENKYLNINAQPHSFNTYVVER